MGDVLAFDHAERSRRVNSSAAAKAGRKKIAIWLDHIEGLRKQRLLLPVHCVVARGLTNFPSATLSGYVWSSQPTLALSIAVSPRTISRAIAALRNEAALLVIQRGARSARYVFCIEGLPINDAALAPHKKRGSASPRMAMESCDSSESVEPESPPNPHIITDDADEISFETLWCAVRGERGHTGPAITAWSKLTTADRLKVGNLIGPSGLELDGMWLSTWLTNRRYAAAPLRRDRSFDNEKIEAPRFQYVDPGSPEWHRERERRIAAGESVAVMDERASEGRGVTVRVPSDDSRVDLACV